LRQAVSRQLLSDVEIGSYLSGGMDSGTLTALAATELPYIKTFTCGFDLSSATGVELGYDERVRAEAMSALFKTEHYEMVLKSGDMERCLDTVVQAIEEPRVGQSYPNYYVARLASKFVKVVLSGAGGDELFGGYPWRYYIGSDSKNFEQYINLYIGEKGAAPRVYEEVNSRWEYAVALTPTHEFIQVSFVNGIYTSKGGKHEEYILNQITKKLVVISAAPLLNSNISIAEQTLFKIFGDTSNVKFDKLQPDFITYIINFKIYNIF
jgi:hypothetical protein